jgi:4-amino-4-deoxy-L-arabinose transferase-like glycosyltransferase
MAGGVVLLTGLLARDLGGGKRATTFAAACAAVSVFVVFTGHLLSTSTVDLLCWTAVSFLVVRALRTGDDRLWLVAGVVLGLGLLNKPLPAFLAVGLLCGVVIAGPRELLRNGWVWAGALVALLLWAPWLLWQADHGWPQLDVAESLRGGNSTSAEPWWAVVPFQALLVGPLLTPVFVAGLVRVFRDERFRFLGWTWVVLALVFVVSGGKPYYLAGLLPLLLAAGAVALAEWRPAIPLVVLSGVTAAVIALPVLPASDADLVLSLNEDVGETIGWPRLVETVASVHARAPSAVILTSNYGEAGAIDRYGASHDLPRAYSGHNAYHEWGPPPDGSAPVVVVGRRPLAHLRGCRVAARVDTGVDNQEDGVPVSLCDGPRRPWSRAWPALRRLG